MNLNLEKFTIVELLLIYKNQSRLAYPQHEFNTMSRSHFEYFDSIGGSYLDFDTYENSYSAYENYEDYLNYSEYSEYSEHIDYTDSCFITTAVCQTFGKPDDCCELMAFRQFRDTYMKNDENQKNEVEQYYIIAPKICEAIDKLGNTAAKQEYAWIWDRYLSHAYEALINKDYETTYHIYRDMVLRLKEKYLAL